MGIEANKIFYTRMPNLSVATNHKPLVKIFGYGTFDEIRNTRLFRLKQGTLPWRFSIHHLAGKTSLAADAASSYPNLESLFAQLSLADHFEHLMMTAISSETEDITTVSWDLIAEETR